MLRDGTLLKVTKSSVEQLITSPGLASGGEVPAALSAGTSAVNRLVAPLPAVHAAVVLEASALPAQGGLRRLVLLSGALLITLQLGTTLLLLLWVGRHLRRMHLRHAEETTHIRDHALRSIKDMLGSMPATLYRGELFADRSLSITSMSENVERLTGFDQAAMLRPNAWRDRVPASDQPVLAQHLNTLYREGDPPPNTASTMPMAASSGCGRRHASWRWGSMAAPMSWATSPMSRARRCCRPRRSPAPSWPRWAAWPRRWRMRSPSPSAS
ncbi:hypothetical protein ACFQU7_14845 [Pseudoroseomonas wenyumeiae]